MHYNFPLKGENFSSYHSNICDVRKKARIATKLRLDLYLTSDPLGGRLELGKVNSNFLGAPRASGSALLLLLKPDAALLSKEGPWAVAYLSKGLELVLWILPQLDIYSSLKILVRSCCEFDIFFTSQSLAA